MKKNFKVMTVLASAALLLTACSSDKLEATSQAVNNPASNDNSIQFGTYMGRATNVTRAGSKGIIDDDVLKVAGYGFGVIAFNTGSNTWATSGSSTKPNFMYNENIYWDGASKWIYDNVKYWPNDFNNGAVDREEAPNTATGSGTMKYNLSFFAYAPFVQMSSYSTSTDVTIDPSGDNIETKYFAPSETTDGIVAMTYNEKQGNPLLKYILTDAVSTNAVDMLWGKRGNTSGYDLANGATEGTIGEYNTDLTKQTVSEQVNFLFKHALAKIAGHDAESSTGSGDFKTGLQVILDIDKDGAIVGGSKDDKTLVTINDVLIEDWYTYNHRIDGTSTEKSDLMTEGWFDIAQGKWYDVQRKLGSGNGVTYNSGTTTTTSTGVAGKLNPEIAEPTSTIACDGTKWTLDGTERKGVVDTEAKDVYSADSDVPAVFMIPAPEGTDNDQTLVVTVTYTVRTYDSKLASIDDVVGASAGTWTYVKQKITNAVTIPGGSLAPNKYYKLLMHLGLTSVKFTASVADWEEAGNTNDGDGDGTDDTLDKDKDIYLPSNTLSVTNVYDVESAVTTVSMTGGAQTITLPYAAGSYIVGVLNSSASTTPTITLDDSSVGSEATVTNTNGVVTVTFTAANKTASVKDFGTFTLTDDASNTITVTLKQGVGPLSLSASSTLVEATSGTTTITAKVDDETLTLAAADITVSPTATPAANGVVNFPENKTAKRIKYTATVAQGDLTPATIDIYQKSGAITATREDSGNVSASKGAGSTVAITVKDTQDTPVTLDLTNTSDYTVAVTVTSGGNNVTGNCTIQRTTSGVKVVLPANSSASTKEYKISVKVNDATASEITVTQNAAS